MFEIICKHCKNPFNVKSPSDFKGPTARKYCSLKCSGTDIYLKNKNKILQTTFKKGHQFFPKGSKKVVTKNPPKILFGKDNPSYKNGSRVGIRHKFYKKVAYKNLAKECLICKDINNLHVHHIDTDKFNHSAINLCILCNSCHQRLHKLIEKEKRILTPHEGVELLNNRKCRYKFKTPNKL